MIVVSSHPHGRGIPDPSCLWKDAEDGTRLPRLFPPCQSFSASHRLPFSRHPPCSLRTALALILRLVLFRIPSSPYHHVLYVL